MPRPPQAAKPVRDLKKDKKNSKPEARVFAIITEAGKHLPQTRYNGMKTTLQKW